MRLSAVICHVVSGLYAARAQIRTSSFLKVSKGECDGRGEGRKEGRVGWVRKAKGKLAKVTKEGKAR